jgi:MOSC domain-containing protein YiiM
MKAGVIHQINLSNGGVPKTCVESAFVKTNGIEGDRQEHTDVHGGPERAVCLYALEVIERLRGEGHPIEPGTTGENVTLAGLDWSLVVPGSRLVFDGGVVLEVASYTKPCRLIAASFAADDFNRILQADRPGESRVYARVITEGTIRTGESVVLEGGCR